MKAVQVWMANIWEILLEKKNSHKSNGDSKFPLAYDFPQFALIALLPNLCVCMCTCTSNSNKCFCRWFLSKMNMCFCHSFKQVGNMFQEKWESNDLEIDGFTKIYPIAMTIFDKKIEYDYHLSKFENSRK